MQIDMNKYGKNVGVFLNRLLGLNINDQKLLFEYFQQTHDAVLEEAKANSSFDKGVVTIESENISIMDGCASSSSSSNVRRKESRSHARWLPKLTGRLFVGLMTLLRLLGPRSRR